MRRPPPKRVRGRAGRLAAMIVLVLALLAAAGWLGVGFVAAERLTQPQRRFDAANHPGTFGGTYRDVALATDDGISLAAWHLPVPGSDAGVVLVHGHEASRSWEFGGRFPELAATLQANGYHVVMLDLRGHGASGGERFSFGHLERLDVRAAVDLLMAEGVPPGSVGVLGVSMGAASAIGAAADDPRVGALWADSGYADILPVLEARWPAASGLPMPFLHGTRLAHRLRYGFDLGGVRPEEEIARVAPRPIQIVHGTADTTVPYGHAQRLAAASGADLWTLPGVAHAAAYGTNPTGYAARVVEFFDVALRIRTASVGR
jgi:uncharacterized protein